MNATINFAALVVVYVLVVYLIAVRMQGQKPLPWLLLILVQAASIYHFKTLCRHISQIDFFTHLSETGIRAMTSGILVAVNIFLILLMNFIFCPRESKKNNSEEFKFTAEDIPPIRYNTEKPSTINWDEAKTTTREEIPNITASESSHTTNSDGDKHELETLDSIHKLINDGKKEEAIKYLRMAVMFGKDPAFTQKAKNLLEEIQAQENS